MTRTHFILATAAATCGLLLASASSSRTQGIFTALPTEVAAPADNPTTPEKVALGRLLFWDPILSGQKDVACATCHHPDFGYAENLDLSIGANGVGLGAARAFATGTPARFVKRNSQTVLNTAFNGIGATGHYTPSDAPMFWDSRVAQPRNPGARTHQGARGDARRRLSLNTTPSRQSSRESRRFRSTAASFARAFGTRDAVNVDNLVTRARRVRTFARHDQRAVRSLHARRRERDDTRAGPGA